MYARVTIVSLQKDKIDDGIKVMRDSILPAAKKEKGFKSLLLIGNRSTGKGYSITLWNTEAEMKTGESSGYYQQQVAKMMPLMAGPPTMDQCEVLVQG
jgi:hypothetical protein